MKVLVSAFTCFNNASVNFSSEVIKHINNVDKVIVDVLYDKSYECLLEYGLDDYDLIVSLGEARSRDCLTLELEAKNISSCSIPDNALVYKKDCVIIEGGDSVLKTKVNVSKLDNIVKFSNDAGKYVCNNLYYHLLYNYPHKSIFIHVPHCHDLEEEYIKYAKIIEKIIEVILC